MLSVRVIQVHSSLSGNMAPVFMNWKNMNPVSIDLTLMSLLHRKQLGLVQQTMTA
jgi:hypothetical protein